jgi:ligand-binding sensor domain-containing protein
MSKNKFLFALILVFCAKIILPQNDLRFEHLSLQDGVAHNLTNCMMKDSKGFLWFGTMYGLARYEGTGYTIFKNDPDDPKSISFDDIISLFEDKKGNIWIGTWGGGLNKYDPFKGEFTRFIFQKDKPDGINDNTIWAICEDNAGNIWLGTERGGLNKYNPETEKFTQYKHDDSNPKSILSNSINSLLCDSKGNLWIGSRNGLSKFNG